MAGGDNGDGDKKLGLDPIWHSADWDSLNRVFRARASFFRGRSHRHPAGDGRFCLWARWCLRRRRGCAGLPGLDGGIVHTMPVCA